MNLIYTDGLFILNCTYDERSVPKDLGFRWNADAKRWYTDNPGKANYLYDLADEDTKAEITMQIAARESALEESKAIHTSLQIPSCPDMRYRDYQKAGIAYASKRDISLIADEMGLGKTIQAIGVLNLNPDAKSILIVCPATLKLNWKIELEKWLVADKSIGIAAGKVFPDTDIVIINYDILTKHAEVLKSKEWDILIADEAHYVKSRKAKRSKALLGIKAKKKIYMTGTPILNRPVELYNILSTLPGKPFGNYTYYTRRYCNGHQDRWGYNVDGSSNEAELNEKLRELLMVRRLKEDVLKELPAKVQRVISFDGGAIARKEAKAIGDFESVIDDMDNFALKDFSEISRIRHEAAINKVKPAVDYIKNEIESCGKLVVFAYHKDVIEALQEAFPNSVSITGETPMGKRQVAIEKFQNDPDVKVFIGNYKAAGVGITLTSSSRVVFVEFDWSYAINAQAEDRVHRIGQSANVLIDYLVFEGTIDAAIAKKFVGKEKIVRKILK